MSHCGPSASPLGCTKYKEGNPVIKSGLGGTKRQERDKSSTGVGTRLRCQQLGFVFEPDKIPQIPVKLTDDDGVMSRSNPAGCPAANALDAFPSVL